MADTNPITDHVEAGFSWCEAGEGDVVLFLHPIVGTRHYWDAQLDALADRWRVVALDAPGYGDSMLVAEPLAQSVTERILAFIDHLGVERADLVGLSLGGMHALHAAASAPERFGRLVLADTSAAFGIAPEPWLTDWLAPVRSGVSMSQMASDSIEAITFVALDHGVRDELASAFETVSIAGFELASQMIVEHNVREQLPSIGHRCLVIVGEHDGETPVEYSTEIASIMPNANLEVIEGVGHLSSIEAPQAFTNLVRNFLAAYR